MNSVLVGLCAVIASGFRTRAALQAEILALRHPLAVLPANAPRRLRLSAPGVVGSVIAILVGLAPMFKNRSTRHGYRLASQGVRLVLDMGIAAPSWKTESSGDIRGLIQRMSQTNPLWGAPRIHGELLKLGIEVAQSAVAKYLPWHRKPPSQTWRTFLMNQCQASAIHVL
jgi:hypothetical protein